MEEEHFRLQVLIDQHLQPEKIDDFISYWEGHEAKASAQSALNNEFELLETFTSNNSARDNEFKCVSQRSI